MLLAAVLSAWLQYAADGKPHARVLAPRTCPSVSFDNVPTAMRQRAGQAPGFDEVVCDAPIPSGAIHIAVEGHALPRPPKSPRRIVVLGDTGCRMKAQEQQNCGDIADWPFPKIARTIARIHPDLLVDIGDYYYRENNCPAIMTKCVNRWGDTSMSWNADWFAPGKPLFASTPLVMARGNHEDCHRGGLGWFRYLDPADAVTTCDPAKVDGAMPWAASFDGLRIVVADSAGDPSDDNPDDARIAYYKASFQRAQALAAGPAGNTWFVTHRPPYANTNETQALLALGWNFAPFVALLSGHIHDFEAINLSGYPPLIINGESGDDLDDAGTAAAYIATHTSASGRPVYTLANPVPYATKQFGFAIYTKTAAGWSISLRDADGIERRTCSLSNGAVSC